MEKAQRTREAHFNPKTQRNRFVRVPLVLELRGYCGYATEGNTPLISMDLPSYMQALVQIGAAHQMLGWDGMGRDALGFGMSWFGAVFGNMAWLVLEKEVLRWNWFGTVSFEWEWEVLGWDGMGWVRFWEGMELSCVGMVWIVLN